MAMDAKIKKAWTDALTSGNYAIGAYDMCRSTNHWSALGVLMDVVDPSHWDMKLPPPHAKEGANEIYAKAKIEGPQMVEVLRMQKEGKTFAEIAAHITANY